MSPEGPSTPESADAETGGVMWEDDTLFTVAGVELAAIPPRDQVAIAAQGRATTERLALYKRRSLVERHLDLLTDLDPDRMVELGVKWGGSIALSWLVARPRRLIGVELDETPVPKLVAFIRAHELDDVVRVHYGVDQGDRSRLGRIVTDEFVGEPIDLIVDDASHLYDQTRASFEVLFPHLRSGGLYVIEDWNHDHLMAEKLRNQLAEPESGEERRRAVELEVEITRRLLEGEEPDPPLSVLLLELLLVKASGSGVIDGITVTDNWILVRRGEQSIDRNGFRLSECYRDHFDFLDHWASAVPRD